MMRESRSSEKTPSYNARIGEQVRLRHQLTPWTTELWGGRTLSQRFADTVQARPAATMLIEQGRGFSFQEVDQEAARLAAGLATRDVGKGDAIAYQLPNWREAVIIFLAANRLGAHLVPLVPTLGAAELRTIFRETAPRFHFVDGQTSAWREVHQQLAKQEHHSTRAVPVRGTATDIEGYEDFLHEAPEAPRPTVDPQGVAAVIYTSGSTAAPKGALHLHETLAAEIDSLRQAHELKPEDRVLMPSPLGHISGVIHGILTPALLGTTAVLQPKWDPGDAIQAIETHAVSYMIGAPVFLQEILKHPGLERHDLRSLRLFSCGGAPVSASLLAEAREKLPSLTAKRVYGSSEFPTISTTGAKDAETRGHDSEGKPLRGITIRITDELGRDLPAGSEGEVRACGPECFLGYADPQLDAEAFDEDGYFRTGDLGILDEAGYLRISGRLKDIIVRKGENISAAEIEEQVMACCPEFAEMAVIALTDAERGEIACACGHYAPGAGGLSLDQLCERLRARGVGTRKLPERLEIFSTFPRTPSGKVDKRKLARILQDSAPPPLAGKDLRG